MDSSKFKINKDINLIELSEEDSSDEESASQSKEPCNSNSLVYAVKNDPIMSSDLSEDQDLLTEESEGSMSSISTDICSNIYNDFTQRSTVKQVIKKPTTHWPCEETFRENVQHNKDCDGNEKRIKSPEFVTASGSARKKPKICKTYQKEKFTKNKGMQIEKFASLSFFPSTSASTMSNTLQKRYYKMDSLEYVIKKEIISIDLSEDSSEDSPQKVTSDLLKDQNLFAEENVSSTSNKIHSTICNDFTQRSYVKQVIKRPTTYWSSEETFQQNVEANEDYDDNKNKTKSSSTSASEKPKICEANPQRKFTKAKDKQMKIKKFTSSTSTPSTSTPSTFILPTAWKNYKDQCILPNETKHEYFIGGVKVTFPMEPYDSQKSVMEILIKNCKNSTNCLIESPTGSGKTLALLCSALAWQTRYTEEIEWAFDGVIRQSEIVGEGKDNEKDERCTTQYSKGTSPASDPTKLSNTSEPNEPFRESMINLCEVFQDNEKKHITVPKIYYCTRTHRQIKQVIKELARTVYKNAKMTILSSREHSCIQDTSGNKTEYCHNLLDPEKLLGCRYYNEINKKNNVSIFDLLKGCGISMPFDIEDLVEVGRVNNFCPYFAAKNLIEKADIIFCPYNYIIDPDIRESMQINIKNQVIILDEAHNIEDICRDVASAKFTTAELEFIIKDCKKLILQQYINAGGSNAYEIIIYYVTTLNEFMNQILLSPSDKRTELTSVTWTGNQLIGLLEVNDLGLQEIMKLSLATQLVIAEFNKAKENNRSKTKKLTISRTTKFLLHRLTLALKTVATQKHENDFKAYIDESSNFSDPTERGSNESWMRIPPMVGKSLRTLRLICLNSAIIFGPLAEKARSIILASGTLSPTESFESELATKFSDIHCTDHVISKDQVFIKCVPRGPTGKLLKANFANVNTWQFQDELGQLIVNITEAVPHGILCFFSSYIMMNNQISRWRFTNVWRNIEKYKKIFIEPREGSNLKDVMNKYREVINDTSDINLDNKNNSHSGAILFAVFRGKVAEGIDFSDNEARCVLTIGIPYPVRNNKDVQMKWNYNDQNASKGLLKGSDWYNIQAYRAYNQALGRCIRHRNDWGAILLVDERFLMENYQSSLPKWTRNMLVKNSKDENIVEELKAFVRSKKILE